MQYFEVRKVLKVLYYGKSFVVQIQSLKKHWIIHKLLTLHAQAYCIFGHYAHVVHNFQIRYLSLERRRQENWEEARTEKKSERF